MTFQNLLYKPTIYDAIRHAKGQSIEDCIPWLHNNHLTFQATTLLSHQTDQEKELEQIRFATPCQRVPRLSKRQLAAIRDKSSVSLENAGRLWQEYRNARKIEISLDPSQLPSRAIASYRAFHLEPSDEWGIYIYLDKLMVYVAQLFEQLKGKILLFTFESLFACALFEVFHHEFFHHLAEAAATTLEFVSSAFGNPRSIFLDYRTGAYNIKPGLGLHPDHPLEEGLANAYAYNSFSFLSFTRRQYRDGLVRIYQRILPKIWRFDNPGYSSAWKYTEGGYISGAAQLLSMMLASESVDPDSLLLLGRNVLLNGHAAFEHKADIPTYLVGSGEQIERFYGWIPAPNETYTYLFWHKNTKALDAFFQQQYEIEKANRKARKEE